MKEKRDTRARNWTFILYPESAPENWIEVLQKEKIRFAVSPLHDKDINEGTGEIKKAHYHVLLQFDGNKAYAQILKITESLSATVPQACNSAKGLIRYFVHYDNPEKYQYSIQDIYSYGDIDIVSPFQTSVSRYQAIKDMIAFIDEVGITEFSDLMTYAASEHEEWFRYLCDSCAYVVGQHIKSRRHKRERE